jgi:hypothetical protein
VKNYERKVSELHDVVENEPQSNFRRILTACSFPETAGYPIMTEYI